MIKKHGEETSGTSITSSKPCSPATPAGSTTNDTGSHTPKPAKAPVCDPKTLSATLIRAKELAARAQRRIEKEAEESTKRETEVQDR